MTTTATPNRTLTGLRLDLAEINLILDARLSEVEELRLRKTELEADIQEAVFKDVAGYGETDTPSMPKRSAYMPGPAGEAAWVAAYERWERYSKLAASAT